MYTCFLRRLQELDVHHTTLTKTGMSSTHIQQILTAIHQKLNTHYQVGTAHLTKYHYNILASLTSSTPHHHIKHCLDSIEQVTTTLQAKAVAHGGIPSEKLSSLRPSRTAPRWLTTSPNEAQPHNLNQPLSQMVQPQWPRIIDFRSNTPLGKPPTMPPNPHTHRSHTNRCPTSPH